jgi:hypothetical protein
MGEAEDAERERRREKKREKKRQAKLIDVNVSEQDVEAALAQGERAKTEEESDAGEGKKKSKKQRVEKREKEEQAKQQAEEQGNAQEAFSSQKRFLEQRSAGTGLVSRSHNLRSDKPSCHLNRLRQQPAHPLPSCRLVRTYARCWSPGWAVGSSERQKAERGGVEEAQGACAEGPQGGHAVPVHVESRQGGFHDAVEVLQTAPKLAFNPSLRLQQGERVWLDWALQSPLLQWNGFAPPWERMGKLMRHTEGGLGRWMTRRLQLSCSTARR